MKRTELNKILIVFSVAFLVCISPAITRWSLGIPGIIGFPTYYHQRISEYMVTGTFNWYDPLSFGGRPYTYPPLFSYMLAGFGFVLGLELGGVIMMGLLGGLTAVLCFLIARELIGKKNAFMVILLSSPAFIFLFSHLSTRSPPITLGLLAIYMVLKKKPWWLVSLPLALSLIFHPETGLIFSFLALIADKRYLRNMRFVALALLLSGAFYVPFYLAYGFPQPNAIHADYAANPYGLESFNLPFFAWETGSNYDNVALLALVLSFIGLYSTKNSFLRKWFMVSFILALAFTRFLLYLVLPAALLAAAGLDFILKRYKKWSRLILPAFVIYFVVIGAWMVVSFANFFPLQKQTDAFLWMRGNTPENVTVISDWTYGHWITGIAYRKSFMDGYAEYAPQADLRMAGLELFYANCTVPEGYGIGYAYMEDWFIKEKNMTCLDSFQKVYEKDGILVYKLT